MLNFQTVEKLQLLQIHSGKGWEVNRCQRESEANSQTQPQHNKKQGIVRVCVSCVFDLIKTRSLLPKKQQQDNGWLIFSQSCRVFFTFHTLVLYLTQLWRFYPLLCLANCVFLSGIMLCNSEAKEFSIKEKIKGLKSFPLVRPSTQAEITECSVGMFCKKTMTLQIEFYIWNNTSWLICHK